MSESMPLEQLGLEPMANGWSYIRLTEQVGWEAFPAYAEVIAAILDALLGTPIDAADTRMRELELGDRRFWIVYDDYPLGVTIEPRSVYAARDTPRIHEQLLAYVSGS